MADPTYIFRNGKVYTLVDGKVVASVKEADFEDHPVGGHPIESPVEMPGTPPALEGSQCPGCGQHTQPQDSFCPNCGNPLSDGSLQYGDEDPYQDLGFSQGEPIPAQAVAKIVTTPNGLKGRVLASVPGVWGDEVTVRFENGVIKRIPIDHRLTFSSEETKTAAGPIGGLEERLAARASSDKESLVERAKELDDIKREAAALVTESSDTDIEILDRISVEADYELREVRAALEHFTALEGEGFEAPAPIENLPAVEQASLRGTDANWLDSTLGEMISEAKTADYGKIMDEGPEAFVAGLDDSQLADAGTVRVMASREIRSQTAGADEDLREKYEKVWLARVEQQRRERLSSRKEEIRKEASTDDGPDAPDEALFL